LTFLAAFFFTAFRARPLAAVFRFAVFFFAFLAVFRLATFFMPLVFPERADFRVPALARFLAVLRAVFFLTFLAVRFFPARVMDFPFLDVLRERDVFPDRALRPFVAYFLAGDLFDFLEVFFFLAVEALATLIS
jgi:hypothetical protein